MRGKTLKHGGIRNPTDLVQIQGLDDEREISTSLSTISFDFDNFPGSVIDDLDQIYTHRYHKRCITLTHLTLISMTFGVISWMIYWLIYNRCEKLLSLEFNSFICKFVFIFEILIFTFLSLSAIFFILMIIFWIRFSCQNPIDPIRNNFHAFKLEGNQWKDQLEYYFKQKTTCFHFLYFRKRKKLIERNFGYIILSPHGIIFDELFLLTSPKHIIFNGTLIGNGRILKLELKQYLKSEILIYLPEEIINQEAIEEFMQILKINIEVNRPARF